MTIRALLVGRCGWMRKALNGSLSCVFGHTKKNRKKNVREEEDE